MHRFSNDTKIKSKMIAAEQTYYQNLRSPSTQDEHCSRHLNKKDQCIDFQMTQK